MIYTWGYVKENTLSKLNLTEEEANEHGFLSRFPYYANEAMTQICSAVFPHEKFFEVEILDENDTWKKLTQKHGLYLNNLHPINEVLDEDADYYEQKEAFWKEWNSLHFANKEITFPSDFISFSDDVALYKTPSIFINNIPVTKSEFVEAFDEQLYYVGYNQIICKVTGTFRVPYKARWFFFTKDLKNDVIIKAPIDVIDAIPSYIVSQCLKIDDETKSAIYRNEYEMFLARIDNTSFKSQRTITIGGNW